MFFRSLLPESLADFNETKGNKQMIAKNNALARSLYESSIRNIITEGTYLDSRKDKWSSHSVVRNERHQNFVKSKENPTLDGIQHEEQARQVFLNHRTQSVHEGPMMLHPDGKVSPHSYGSEPALYHSSHYFSAE